MRITIDNLDGNGVRDHTAAVLATGSITLHRVLGERTRCTATLLLTNIALNRGARVMVQSSESGAMMFTGSLLTEPVREYLGEATEGAAYQARITAVSYPPPPPLFAVHEFTDADGDLTITAPTAPHTSELANDVTLSGETEPTSLVQEIFLGDGTTSLFTLSGAAYRDPNTLLAQDRFTAATLDAARWNISDPGGHFSLTGAGLTISGGNGADGVTTVLAPGPIEMSGVLVTELTGVQFGAGSAGMLAGFYGGPPVLPSCLAGFRVKQVSGNTVLVPVVDGAEVGTAFTPLAGHRYTLWLRMHCREMQRVFTRYTAVIEGAVQTFGPSAPVEAPMDFVFELRDEGLASNTAATVLYDSGAAGTPLAASPAQGTFAVANSEQLVCSIASVTVRRTGSLWVTSVGTDGIFTTRSIGLPNQGLDCAATYGTSTGQPAALTFFDGREPGPGERVTVSYRESARSIARLQNAATITREANAGVAGAGQWRGKLLAPAARSSADCESAAQAMLALGGSSSAAISGEFTTVNPPEDIAPGDTLRMHAPFFVSRVEITDGGSEPETLRYTLGFSNTWPTQRAAGLGLSLGGELAADAEVPVAAAYPADVPLANLQALTVTALTTDTLALDTGVDPPAGGGFEVRRRDNGFGPGTDADLVLRSPVRAFSFPRAAQNERFAVRQYDASTPPKYSRWAAAIALHAPIG